MTLNPRSNVADKLACSKKQYSVTLEQTPLSCPMPEMTLWNAHPRVYLSIEETGHAVCPYCGAEYMLVDNA